MSGSHKLRGSNYKLCWFRRPRAEVEVSTDVGFHEGCGESVPSFPPHFQGFAGHGGHVWAWRAPPSSSPGVLLCVRLPLNVSFVWGQLSC